MRSGFVGVICAIALGLIINNGAYAQEGYRRLTIHDFQGTPHPQNGSISATHCSIDFHYHVRGEKNHYQLTFDIKLIMDKDQSWMDKRRVLSQELLSEVLNHEQGHYTISYMEQQELLRETARTRFTANYQAEANALFDRIHAKYELLNNNYDEDTQHMCNRTQQHSWDVYFQKRLMYMPPINV